MGTGERPTVNQKTAETPLVSLVIPVFNSMPYLVETLDAIETQGLAEDQLEVILVNDGSTDGSEKVLAEYAAKHPNYRLLNQPNSGGPADPCNKGIAAVTGKYFFVVGSDDVLTEGALGDLAAYAEKHGSDIVLAKMAGLNGRHAPGSMFKATKADAHLVDDNLFNSLTAIKLFRTDLVKMTGAHNPTHLRIGSDQPFTAACYLVAKKISVRADKPFVLIRKREDGRNVTSRERDATEYSDLLTALVDVIIRWSEPGELRDGVLHRPVQGAMRKALHPRFLNVDEQAQEHIVSEMQRVVGPHFNDAVAAHLSSFNRLKARLALAGRLEELRAVMQWEKDGGQPRLGHDGNGFHLDLPEELRERVGGELLRDVKVVGVPTLEDLEVDSELVRLGVSAHVRDGLAAADDVLLRLRRRGTEELIDLPALEEQPTRAEGLPAVRFQVEIDAAALSQGVWDLWVVQRFGEDELENRLGRHRSERVTDERRLLIDATGSHKDRGIVYFTKGHGNVSLDIGYTLLARTGPEVTVAGVLDVAAGHRVALLRVDAADSLQVTALEEETRTGAGTEVLGARLEGGLLAVSVPDGTGSLRVANPHGVVVLPLPRAVELSAAEALPAAVPAPIRGESIVEFAQRAGRGAARRLRSHRPFSSKRR